MHSMRLFFSTCIFLSGLYSIKAQNADESYLSQIVEIEWKIFNTNEQTIIDSLTLVKSSLYKESADYQSALKSLDRINLLANSRFEKEIVDEKIILNFLLRNNPEVQNLILQTTFIDGYEKSDDIKLIEAINFIRLHKLDESKSALSALGIDSARIVKVFDTKSFRDPSKAFKMSFMLPGLGQMYAGKFLKGMFSLGINSALFYTGVHGVRRRYFFTEALPGIALFQGFYFGGAEYAEKLTIERNQFIVDDLSKKVLGAVK